MRTYKNMRNDKNMINNKNMRTDKKNMLNDKNTNLTSSQQPNIHCVALCCALSPKASRWFLIVLEA